VLWPVGEAFADRAPSQQAKQKTKAKRSAPTPTSLLALTGTYALTSLNGRPVRDAELAKSTVTFRPRGEVAVNAGCNGFGTKLSAKPSPNHILGFTQQIGPLISCPPNQARAEAVVSRLFSQTANIARASNTVTFFNATGTNIAQWTAVANVVPTQPEASAPQTGAPTPSPVRTFFGDYILTELNGRSVTGTPARPVPPPQQGMPAPQVAPAPENSVSQPSLFLREDGRVMGSSGCNQYNSALVTSSGGAARFGPIVTTKKACLNPNMRALETNYFSVLRQANRVVVSGSHIDLFAPNGRRSARLSSIGARGDAGPSLFGKRWILTRLNNVPVRGLNPPVIEFGANIATGNTGCNQFSIQHERSNGSSRFSNATMTERACADTGPNSLESRFIRALEAVSLVEISTTSLTLSSIDLRTKMVFEVQ
jgi:heat shock protein HslJ